MKKVAKSSKAKGKEAARELTAEELNTHDEDIAGLPNGDNANRVDESEALIGEEHDREATVASYRTANDADEDDEEESEQAGESSDDDGGTQQDTSSQATSSRGQGERIGQSHDRSKRPRAVQDIFKEDSLTKVGSIVYAELFWDTQLMFSFYFVAPATYTFSNSQNHKKDYKKH